MITLIVCILVAKYSSKKTLEKLDPVVTTISILFYGYSLVKFLVFDENAGYIYYPGVYINVVSSILCSTLLYVIVKKSVIGKKFGYEQLENEDEESTTTENTDSENEEDKKEEDEARLPLFQHIWLIAKICGKQWRFYTVSYVLLLVVCGLTLMDPWLYGTMINVIVQQHKFTEVALSIAYLYGLWVIISFVSAAKSFAMGIAQNRTSCQVRIALFNALLKQEIAFFDTNKTGQLMSRITHDSGSISESLPKNFETATKSIVTVCGTVPIMLYLSWRLTTIAFISFPLFWLSTKYYGLFTEKLSEIETNTTARSNETVQEVFSAIRTVRSFAAEKMEMNNYKGKTDECYKIGRKSVLFKSIFDVIWSMCWIVMGFAVFTYGAYLADTGRMSSKTILSFIFYHYNLINTLNSFSNMFTDLMKTIGSSRKVISLLHRAPLIDLEQGNLEPEISGEIAFEEVDFSYPTRKNTDVLKGLNLVFEPGKTTALVGHSGNGKTTIVSLIQHYYEPKNGRISIDGVPVQNIRHEYYHKKIALVAQEPTLFSGTIRDNILYGMEEATEDDMLRVSKLANVDPFVSKLEKGYDTLCGEKGVQMSGGQKQRIAIARALIRDPSVLILDEATSALDTESEAEVQEALNRCATDRTVIVIAHRLSTVRKADRIAVVQKGQIVEIGTHDELIKNSDGAYYKLVSKQADLS
ncbi:unnamed protein product [Caenorhabditis bovis]|uniref:Uncharacterized protein n=1 Tax=Caenorhabditis bovis TaxID=2654633 RepID=A0A8S1E8S5_9PELO|nr:unnamed protein product [Caenorhabditis bovis]